MGIELLKLIKVQQKQGQVIRRGESVQREGFRRNKGKEMNGMDTEGVDLRQEKMNDYWSQSASRILGRLEESTCVGTAPYGKKGTYCEYMTDFLSGDSCGEEMMLYMHLRFSIAARAGKF